MDTLVSNSIFSAVGLEFDTMSYVSENSEEGVKKSDTVSSIKTSTDQENFTSTSGFEPISSSSKRFSEVYDSDAFPKSLIDGYHRYPAPPHRLQSTTVIGTE